MKTGLTTLALGIFVAFTSIAGAEEGEWKTIFDGKSLDGWKINENKSSFKLEDGVIVSNGDRSHLFYVGDDKPFVDFELELDVMTKKNSNAGVYFHTKFQETGWPKYGFEAQVNNTYNRDPRKTGSIYQIKDIKKAPAKDDTWFKYSIKVKGKEITISIDGKVINKYTEPADQKAGKDFTRKLDKGTFAIQAHDPGSKVLFKNIRVRRLD